MKAAPALFLLIGLTQMTSTAQSEEGCKAESAEYERLSDPIFVGAKASAAEVATYEKSKDAATQALHEFAVQSILSRLRTLGSTTEKPAAAVESWVRCLQSRIPQYAKLSEWTNAPLAFTLDRGPTRVAVVYGIDRGYEAIPQITYFIEIYESDGRTWRLLASETPHEFDASSLTVNRMTEPTLAEHWFLLTGRPFGDTAGRLHIQLLSFDRRGFTALWSEVKPKSVVVSVEQNQIVLNTEVVDRNGQNAQSVTSTFRVERSGLRVVAPSGK